MKAHTRLFCLLLIFPAVGMCGNAQDSIQRMDDDVSANSPLVAHIVVALCDNEFQEIIPVSDDLGNGESPRTNLYWGALYGVKTFFSKKKTWQRLQSQIPTNPYILDRVVFTRKIIRNKKLTTIYVIADAWKGKRIKEATVRFLELSSGRFVEEVSALKNNKTVKFTAGGASHVIAYVGHDGLMDFSIPDVAAPSNDAPASSAIVLACYSNHFFRDKLIAAGSHSLLTTNGLMAPEAYTLDATLTNWFAGRSPSDTHLAASTAYSKYQKAKLWWSKKLFSTSK